MRGEVMLCRLHHTALVVGVDCFRRFRKGFARLHLDKHYRFSAFGDEVNLPTRRFVAPREDAVRLQLQPQPRQRFRMDTAAMAGETGISVFCHGATMAQLVETVMLELTKLTTTYLTTRQVWQMCCDRASS